MHVYCEGSRRSKLNGVSEWSVVGQPNGGLNTLFASTSGKPLPRRPLPIPIMPTPRRVSAIRMRACFVATAQRLLLCAWLACFAEATATPAGAAKEATWRSVLYPENGYDPGSANLETEKGIQDFSYAGYRAGEAPIPDVIGPVFDVTQPPFNADSTGRMDATEAIQAAIDAAGATPGGGVVHMPAGTYLLSVQVHTRDEALRLDKPNVVLRGAGVGRTFLLNTTSVLRPPGTKGAKAIIRVIGPEASSMRAVVPADAESPLREDLLRSTRVIPVEHTGLFQAGDTVVARIDLTDEWLAETREPSWVGNAAALWHTLSFRRTVKEVDAAARTVTLDAPIRHPLKLRDRARLSRLSEEPITGVGLEDFSIGSLQNAGTRWGEGDYRTEGTPAREVHSSRLIELFRARDCWVRRVHSFQAPENTSTAHMLSNGITVLMSSHVTIEDCVFERPQYGGGGGNGYMFTLVGSQECLIKNSEARYSRHGFSITALGASGNVITGCIDRDTGYATGATGEMHTNGFSSDHHMRLSMANLIDTCTGDASWWEAVYRPWGGPVLHGVSATNSVFWNTYGTGRVTSRSARMENFNWAVRSDQGGWGYVIGTRGERSAVDVSQSPRATNGQSGPVDHVEGVGRGYTLEPFSLYQDQVRRRLGAVPSARPEFSQ